MQPVLPWIQGPLTSANHVMLDLEGFLLTRCEKLETPLHVREMLMQYKHEQQLLFPLWSGFERSKTGIRRASMSSVLVLICLLPYITYQGLLCSPQWARHGKLKALSCLLLALTSDESRLIWNSLSSVGSIFSRVLWFIFNHNRLIVGSGISFQNYDIPEGNR